MGCGGSAVMDLGPIEERANEFATWVGKFDSEHRIPAAFASAADVPALLAEVERLRADVARLEEGLSDRTMDLAEVARLRTMVGDCHCDKNPETTNGPEEDCPQHGRPVAEVWGLVERAEAGWDHARAEVDRLRAEAAMTARPAPAWDEEAMTNEVLSRARAALAQASPLQTTPWVARLVDEVVDSTLGVVREHLS